MMSCPVIIVIVPKNHQQWVEESRFDDGKTGRTTEIVIVRSTLRYGGHSTKHENMMGSGKITTTSLRPRCNDDSQQNSSKNSRSVQWNGRALLQRGCGRATEDG